MAFLHVPKSGGLTIDRALRSAFASAGSMRIDRNAVIRSSMVGYAKQLDGSLDEGAKFSDYHASQLPVLMSYSMYRATPFISGHLAVNARLLEEYDSSYDFITVLREPVARFKSNYIFNRLTNQLPVMHPVANNDTDNLISEARAILEHRRGWQLANTSTMCLTGRYPKDKADAQAMRDEVLHNSDRFSVIGFLDDLPGFSKLLCEQYGKEITFESRNQTQDLASPKNQKVIDVLKDFFSNQNVINQVTELCSVERENYERILSKRRT
ncbi:hypothetical protein MHM95_09415 [Pseudoalteromonas sp. CnMc7-15]|uniref:hypothetical protein n=1 Tax=unclassified Pseudoalteromonas TaxID=194690 RepID=UPI001EF4F478|nr:hypothetical protein [Pseudoalteromonas sp. CnMc7-15]MCG7566508.1 hypothetical protein [Pseudoalteromonas sp. CnMc7-15]